MRIHHAGMCRIVFMTIVRDLLSIVGQVELLYLIYFLFAYRLLVSYLLIPFILNHPHRIMVFPPCLNLKSMIIAFHHE